MGTLTLRHGDRRWVCKELWTKQEFGQSIYSKKAGPTCTNANGGSPESLATQVTHMHSWKHPFFRRAPLLDAVVDPFQLKKPSSSSCPFVLSPFRKICLKNVCEQGPRISQGCSLFSHLMTADLFSPVEACRKVDSTHLINLRKLLRASRTLLNSIASVCLPNSQSINQSVFLTSTVRNISGSCTAIESGFLSREKKFYFACIERQSIVSWSADSSTDLRTVVGFVTKVWSLVDPHA